MDSSTQQQHPLKNYQFSTEELRVLGECNTESFFQRSLPLGTALGVGAYVAVKKGFLQPNFKYGAVPKVAIGVTIGYFFGKFSYQQKCAEKLMRLPNSKLGELLRQRKQDGSVLSNLNPDKVIGIGLTLSPFNSTGANAFEEDFSSNTFSLEVESQPTIAGLDDVYRPSIDNPSPLYESEIPIEHAKHGRTYEELRKKNREEHENKEKNKFSRPLPANAPTVIRENESKTPTKILGHKNKYGDTWTD